MQKESQPKISVIVPVYNAEKYLNRCVDSILEQTFTDFEVLLINDGSTDGSGAICEGYKSLDSRVLVFHKENGGVSSARNEGIKHSEGTFLIFIDSDDYLDKGLFMKLSNYFGSNKVDTISFNGVCISALNTSQSILRNSFFTKHYNTFKEYYNEKGFRGEIWLYAFRRSLITTNNVFFSEGIKYAEDLEFTMKCLSLSKGLQSVSFIGYIHTINSDSVMHNKKTYNDILDHFRVLETFGSFTKDKLEKDTYIQGIFTYYIFLALINFLGDCNFRLVLKVDVFYKKYYLQNMIKYNFGVKRNIVFLFAFISLIPFVQYLKKRR